MFLQLKVTEWVYNIYSATSALHVHWFSQVFFIILYIFFNFLFNKKDIGAAYGTAKSGVGISCMGVNKPELIMKSIIPVVMAGILGIYGMIVSVILV